MLYIIYRYRIYMSVVCCWTSSGIMDENWSWCSWNIDRRGCPGFSQVEQMCRKVQGGFLQNPVLLKRKHTLSGLWLVVVNGLFRMLPEYCD